MEKNNLIYGVPQEELERIAMLASAHGLKAFQEAQSKEKKRKAKEENKVKKAKKMLGSYRRIKAKLAGEKEYTEAEKVEFRWKFIEDLMDARNSVSKSERVIDEEERRRQEDLYCIQRIEMAVDMYRKECEKSGKEEAIRRYEELWMMYMGDEQYTVQEIAEIKNVSEKTVYKDIGIACGIVAVYLLGI